VAVAVVDRSPPDPNINQPPPTPLTHPCPGRIPTSINTICSVRWYGARHNITYTYRSGRPRRRKECQISYDHFSPRKTVAGNRFLATRPGAASRLCNVSFLITIYNIVGIDDSYIIYTLNIILKYSYIGRCLQFPISAYVIHYNIILNYLH